jgi:hypothetical protein
MDQVSRIVDKGTWFRPVKGWAILTGFPALLLCVSWGSVHDSSIIFYLQIKSHIIEIWNGLSKHYEVWHKKNETVSVTISVWQIQQINYDRLQSSSLLS